MAEEKKEADPLKVIETKVSWKCTKAREIMKMTLGERTLDNNNYVELLKFIIRQINKEEKREKRREIIKRHLDSFDNIK